MARKLLHQPFFPPYTSSPPSQAPTLSPSPSPSFPKYPSSSSSTSTSTSTSTSSSSSNPNSPPFFPLYPSPPPPSLPTFPANISSLITSSPSHNAPPSSKLIPIISLPILAFALLCLIASFFFVRRKRSPDKGPETELRSDSRRLVPPNATSSSSSAAAASSAKTTSEFLCLGTLANPNGRVSTPGASGELAGLAAVEDSPELRPLPPLSRQVRRSFSSDEEFYSPDPQDAKCGSPERKNEGVFVNCEEPFEAGAPPPRRQAPPPPPPPVLKAGTLPLPVLAPPRVMGAVRDGNVGGSNGEEKFEEKRRPKLKPLHWDKVRASSERAMVWDQLGSSSFQFNEEMIETLFGCDSATKGMGNVRRKMGLSPVPENVVLDPKKSHNIAILLRALNISKEEVCEALLEGNTDSLVNELLETLLKMAPSKEEEIKLREYKDESPSKLGPAEKFLKAMLDIPFAFKRVDAMLYISNFESEVHYLIKSFETLELACEELRNSRLFRKLLDAVLKTGNRMNVGTNRGDAQAFKLDTLLKLVDIKGTDGKTTLLHFVVQEISRSEGFRAKSQTNSVHNDLECRRFGLQIVSGLGSELSNVKKAATMDSEILSSYVSKLAVGIGKIREVVRLNESNERFHETMITFLKTAEGEITKLQSHEGVSLSLVKEITEYFHGDSTKEEAHPFRIFMVVRDFLAILDQVCKDVGRANERSVVSTTSKFSVASNPGNSSAFPQIVAVQHFGSSDDESSSLSSMSS